MQRQQFEGWRPLRSSRSEHHLLPNQVPSLNQDARIHALLEEMRPARRPLRVSVEEDSTLFRRAAAPPNYDVIFPVRNDPPPYNHVALKPSTSMWTMGRAPMETTPKKSPTPGWLLNPRKLSTLESSPASKFIAMANGHSNSYKNKVGTGGVTVTTKIHCNGNDEGDSAPSLSTHTFSHRSPSPSTDTLNENRGITPRNTPRQASFMAAVGRHPLREKTTVPHLENNNNSNSRNNYDEVHSPVRRPSLRYDDGDTVSLQHSISMENPSTPRERRRTTIYGDEILAKCARREPPQSTIRDQNHNDSPVSSSASMRRARPKSYVLATSASLPETEQQPVSFSHDEARDLSSLGSISSIDRSARSANVPHQPATHRIQKFISLFSQQRGDSVVKLRAKRSRTSLPSNRSALPDSIFPVRRILRQGWLRHQELALGKSGKRRQWDHFWAVLFEKQLYLCQNEPCIELSPDSKEELIRISPSCIRIEVAASIADIAYEWLAGTKTRHVIRLLTQTRTEHLFELDTEADMMKWIQTLQQYCAEPAVSPQLHSSCSAASLASSSSTPSERNGHVTTVSATNQLIMHRLDRYKAKTSQLQSPIAGKRPIQDGHYAQPGTSKENSSGENGEPTTPKSGRKWRKSKAGKQGSGSSSSSQPTTQNVLGVRLADCAMASQDDLVPLLVQICVRVVEAHGLDTVGIYRIPGNTAAVNALKDSLGNGFESVVSIENLDFADARWRDVNVVSSLLKMFLRKLPEPLLTDKLYPFFIDANRISSHHQRLHKLRNLLRKLPRHHYATLRYLIKHLSEITKRSSVNKMETRNLALMFGPSIVRPSDDNMATMVTHMSDQCKIIETLIHYHYWMFDDTSTIEDEVPIQHPSETATSSLDTPQYGVGVPTGVSAASFNDMHNLIRKANEDQAAAMMNEGKTGKIKNILRRNSRRDKSKGKLKIESTAPAATHPRVPQHVSIAPAQSSVDSAFCGNYQERDIDAEIESRQTSSPLASSTMDHSPSLESSFGSLPDTSRTDPGDISCNRKRQDIYSARRIFIAGSAAAATSDDTKAIDALASHTHHLNLANSPALDVLSEETREKIRRMQRRQTWMEKPSEKTSSEPRLEIGANRSNDLLKMTSPTKDMTDALSCTSDYSTTSSAPLTAPLAVACVDPPTSSDYASSDPSPCARNASTSPRQRPAMLPLTPAEARCQQKIRLRSKTTARDPRRRHTLSDVDALKEGRMEKLARWFGLRKSSPDISSPHAVLIAPPISVAPPPAIVRTSPNELTPASGDEQL